MCKTRIYHIQLNRRFIRFEQGSQILIYFFQITTHYAKTVQYSTSLKKLKAKPSTKFALCLIKNPAR
jgi:hypothetical protein